MNIHQQKVIYALSGVVYAVLKNKGRIGSKKSLFCL